MNNWTREADETLLVKAATIAIRRALDDGERSGKSPGAWLDEAVTQQLRRAEAHIVAQLCNQNTAEDHLAHIICRAAMSYALTNVDELKNAGRVDNS